MEKQHPDDGQSTKMGDVDHFGCDSSAPGPWKGSLLAQTTFRALFLFSLSRKRTVRSPPFLPFCLCQRHLETAFVGI